MYEKLQWCGVAFVSLFFMILLGVFCDAVAKHAEIVFAIGAACIINVMVSCSIAISYLVLKRSGFASHFESEHKNQHEKVIENQHENLSLRDITKAVFNGKHGAYYNEKIKRVVLDELDR